jgi:hypothetical protein
MTSLITLPIRLPLEITYRAAKLGGEVVRTVAGILDGGERAPWPVEEELDVGAEVHVGPPWDGYDRMRAVDIVDRLQVADEATRAVVRLYEQQGKARSSVLAATA